MKNCIIYQVYLPSFVPTLKKLIKKLDYLKKLKVNIIWLNPIYTTGGVDCGYDVKDYYSINHNFGTMTDFENLVKEAKKLNIGIMMDLVVNHTSNQHKWFKNSIQNGDKRDWYCWYKKEEIHKNWVSVFEDSPWTWCPERQQYYYHYFYSEQPDLNLENLEVITEIKKIIKFWIKKGICGFRLDAIGHYITLPKENTPNTKDAQYNTHKTFTLLEEIKEYVKSIDKNIILLGESDFDDLELAKKFIEILDYSRNDNFTQINKLDAQKFEKLIEEWYKINNGKSPLWYMNNHDLPRQRYGEQDPRIAKLIAALYLLQYGTKIIYYGEEINMSNSKDYGFDRHGRDQCRATLPWSSKKTNLNWIPPSKIDIINNLKIQQKDKNSVYRWYKKITKFQNKIEEKQIVFSKKDLLKLKSDKYKIYFNFSDKELHINIVDNVIYRSDRTVIKNTKSMQPFEVVISSI
jgi:alpha-glucosidase